MRVRDYFDSSFIVGRRTNAVFSWILALYLLGNSFNIFLDGNFLWSIYALSVLLVLFVPVILLKDFSALVPFEILLFLSVPFTVKGMELGFMASHTLSYLSAAAVALLLVTELDTFTSFDTTPDFAAVLVAFTTVAVAGAWAIGRWLSDLYLGTAFIVSENALMWEFSTATLAGLVAGISFVIYFRKRDREVELE